MQYITHECVNCVYTVQLLLALQYMLMYTIYIPISTLERYKYNINSRNRDQFNNNNDRYSTLN